ncbi:MAG TPA: hypothetical protein VGO11_00770 [Chthoniobacteraceae bacterium]|jgi:hypothetical protein|nr:hypothetical protein [Chthoniobacteraceae bacterium]
MATFRRCAPASVLLAVLMLGCAAGSKYRTVSGNRFVVIAAHCQFYKNGPAQAFGPDAVLPAGQKVTMVVRDGPFSQIRLDDNTVGYVSSDELTQLPPEKATPKPVIASRRRVSPPVAERGLDLSDTPAPPLPQ